MLEIDEWFAFLRTIFIPKARINIKDFESGTERADGLVKNGVSKILARRLACNGIVTIN